MEEYCIMYSTREAAGVQLCGVGWAHRFFLASSEKPERFKKKKTGWWSVVGWCQVVSEPEVLSVVDKRSPGRRFNVQLGHHVESHWQERQAHSQGGDELTSILATPTVNRLKCTSSVWDHDGWEEIGAASAARWWCQAKGGGNGEFWFISSYKIYCSSVTNDKVRHVLSSLLSFALLPISIFSFVACSTMSSLHSLSNTIMSWVFFFPNLYIRFSTTLAASLAAKVTTNVVAARETVSTFVVGTLLQNLYDFQVGTFLLNLFDFHMGPFLQNPDHFQVDTFLQNFSNFLF